MTNIKRNAARRNTQRKSDNRKQSKMDLPAPSARERWDQIVLWVHVDCSRKAPHTVPGILSAPSNSAPRTDAERRCATILRELLLADRKTAIEDVVRYHCYPKYVRKMLPLSESQVVKGINRILNLTSHDRKVAQFIADREMREGPLSLGEWGLPVGLFIQKLNRYRCDARAEAQAKEGRNTPARRRRGTDSQRSKAQNRNAEFLSEYDQLLRDRPELPRQFVRSELIAKTLQRLKQKHGDAWVDYGRAPGTLRNLLAQKRPRSMKRPSAR